MKTKKNACLQNQKDEATTGPNSGGLEQTLRKRKTSTTY
jgi:hypothetical protein